MAPKAGRRRCSFPECSTFFAFFSAFFSLPLLFVFVYPLAPAVVLSLVALIVPTAATMFGHIRTLDSGGDKTARGARMMSGIVLALMLLSFITSLGMYYDVVVPVWSLWRRSYHGVYAQQPSAAFQDAAFLNFANGTVVDGTKALGMKDPSGGGHRVFCVAPVADRTSAGRYEFWAIGLDCCGVRNGFTCGNAGEAGALSAFVVPDPRKGDMLFDYLGEYLAPAHSRRDLFEKAVAQAAVAHGVSAIKNPTLVTWGSDWGEDKDAMQVALWLGISFRLLGLLIASFGFAWLLSVISRPLNDIPPKAPRSLDDQRQSEFLARRSVLESAQNLVDTWQNEKNEIFKTNGRLKMIMLGFVVPWVLFLCGVTLWSWGFCFGGGYILVGVFVTLALASIFWLFNATNTSMGKLYGIFLLGIFVMASMIGRYNYYTNTFNICTDLHRRTYSQVSPIAKPTALADAGRIHFQNDTQVNVDYSVGFLHLGVTYCVAPLLNPTMLADARIYASRSQASSSAAAQHGPGSGSLAAPSAGFWAVGKECCDAVGGFRCLGGGDATQGSALILHDYADTQASWSWVWQKHNPERIQFKRAIEAAASRHGLPIPEEPMLLRWGTDLDAIRNEWGEQAAGITILCAIVSGLGFLVFTLLGFWFGYGKYTPPRSGEMPGAAGP